MQSFITLGRQPALGLAELESIYSAEAVWPCGPQAAILDVDPSLLAFDRLGGATKFCKVLTTLETIDWRDIERYLLQAAPNQASSMSAGKMLLGLSAQGLSVSVRQIQATGLSLKKAIRAADKSRSVRLIPNKELELSTAQVHHNKLTGTHGREILLVRRGTQTVVAQTLKVQDIASYTVRDRERPKRDARVGMLPPKLAQMIINLATGPLQASQLHTICDIPAGQNYALPKLSQTILDPFCGTGVLLQEAALMGYDVYGTDLEPRMIDYSRQNLEWLQPVYRLPILNSRLAVADATNANWDTPVDFVACETYLGKPFTATPRAETLAQTVSDCNLIIKKFLRNIHGQLQPGTRLCVAIPAWQTRPGQFKTLPLVDQITEMGYNRVSFEHAGIEQLIYYRPDQIVARQLLVLTKQ